MSAKKPVYLDYNATTPLAPEVVEAVTRSLSLWGNPSSGYVTGQEARRCVKEARSHVARMIGAKEDQEITFTSGGTEANHLAIWSAVASYLDTASEAASSCPSSSRPCHPESSSLPHIVTSNIEHPAVSGPLREMVQRGWARVTEVEVIPGTGRWTVEAVREAITVDTCLVTMMLANNETGFLQPVKELFGSLKDNPPSTRSPLILHTDAAQAIGKLSVQADDLSADMITIVGHKFYGPRIGALYHRVGVRVTPMFYGGGQEAGLRPGTENTPMIAGLGAACDLVTCHLDTYSRHMKEVRDHLVEHLIRNFNLVTSDEAKKLELGQVCWRYIDRLTLPNTLSLRVGGFTGPELLAMCRQEVEASCGAACHTGAGVSRVLVNSFTWAEAGAVETVRLSVGRDTTKAEVELVVRAFREAAERKRAEISQS